MFYGIVLIIVASCSFLCTRSILTMRCSAHLSEDNVLKKPKDNIRSKQVGLQEISSYTNWRYKLTINVNNLNQNC